MKYLCGEENCDFRHCFEEPEHCEYAQEEIVSRREAQYDSILEMRNDKRNDRAEWAGQE